MITRRTGYSIFLRKSFSVSVCGVVMMASLAHSTSPRDKVAKIPSVDSACESAGPKGCVALAAEAMGGATRLAAVKSMIYESVGHTLLVEQSYRQDPFITSYERSKVKIDFERKKLRIESTLTWPESDPGQSESQSVLVGGPEGCVRKIAASSGAAAQDGPCSLSQIDGVRDIFGIGALQVLATAAQAPDLHFAPSEVLRSTPHTVVAFLWSGVPVRILINRFNHLPDAVETEEQFHDHWYQWGDVERRIYLDNWVTEQGIRFPTNLVEERNGIVWQSTQYLDVKFDVAPDPTLFEMDAKVAALGAKSAGWERPFSAAKGSDLAPGITFFPGAWNATVVKQDDGVIVLEAPISGTYFAGVIEEAKKRYSGGPIKAVLSTSDSWPHVGGVRQAVASGLPVYILDLNQPLLNRLVAAKHQIHPDLLAKTPQKPSWRIVSGKTTIGSGPNRVELYPLRGVSTERQYMAYFPEYHLLYASDTLALNDDGSLYDPELMREVMEAVQREGIQVITVFAMHQAPMPWNDVVQLVQKAMR
jgi:hypothetical protein